VAAVVRVVVAAVTIGEEAAVVVGETVWVALGAIRANKLRSFLTMLGIIIGIGAVIAMLALGEGAQRQISAQLDRLGPNVLTVAPGQQFMGRVDRGDAELTARGAEAIAAEGRYIQAVSPEMQRRLQITFSAANASLNVVGVWPSYFDIQRMEVAMGRRFTEGEERGRRRVALVGASVGPKLNSTTESMVGQTIKIRGTPFEVIGMIALKGQQGFSNPDETVYIPLATAQFRVFGTERVNNIYVQALNSQTMEMAIADIDRALRKDHRLRPGEPSDFNVRDQASLVNVFQETTQTFTFLLAGIAFISLIVGGIGIMNIMLVSVTERTREIGVRKAMGARRRDILFQFLVEALALCIAGGALGVGLGMGSASIMRSSAGWQVAVSPQSVVLAISFAASIGLFFGIWPARRAAKLDPIVALRYE
jgi:putative ABC transport system permease protein